MPRLLNSGNYKTRKGEKLGFITYGLHLAHDDTAIAGKTVCPMATKACSAACLDSAGRGMMKTVQDARIAKTKKFLNSPNEFFGDLEKDIRWGIKRARKLGMLPCFRLNLTSDVSWEKKATVRKLMSEFRSVHFYDYTKIYKRALDYKMGLMPPNYSLTFSRSESNENQCKEFLDLGGNVAVVFRNSLPSKFWGYKVIDGDAHDLRFTDPQPCIVGLVEKGKAKKDKSNFVIETH
jgi:hypothetical protein